ncbi:MAG: hypothetical protein HRU22_01970 [Gammaproteobacteria bacterium]|nr:hypothetical protein [Gammaproteobacteria bacterium]
MTNAPIFLFVPVSSAQGIGEYMRSLIIAKQIVKIWPDAKIHFILSKQAPYATSCPFDALLTEKSPTKHVKEVNQFISQLKPDMVIFDASGRKSQLKHAKAVGAKVVFISQHKKKRSRGLKLGRLMATDSHWVVQPEFVIAGLSGFEKFKLALCKKAPPIHTGVIFTPLQLSQQAQLLAKYGVEPEQYIIFNAGSGGHLVGDKLAADIYADAAKLISEQQNIKCLMVYGANYPNKIESHDKVIAISSLDNSEFVNLISAAKAVVISGGDTLLQTIAMRKACLTTPVSKDQPPRISACSKQQLVLDCPSESQAMAAMATTLLQTATLSQLTNAMAESNQKNGLDLAIAEIKRLLMSN